MSSAIKTVLVVEDEEMLAKMYEERFSFAGFNVVVANDGEAGIKMFEEKTPDIIILDVILPKKEGLEVLKEIRESSNNKKNIPIIILTNLDFTENMLGIIKKYPPTEYYMKASIDLKDLVMKAEELLLEKDN